MCLIGISRFLCTALIHWGSLELTLLMTFGMAQRALSYHDSTLNVTFSNGAVYMRDREADY